MGFSEGADYVKVKPDPSSSMMVRVFALLLISFMAFVATYQIVDASGVFASRVPREGLPPPPPHTEYARMARYIVHSVDWTAMATLSTHPGIESFPFANVFSMADGTVANSTGTPYLFLTPLELSVKDLEADSRASLTMSLAQTDYCRINNLDQEDPVCAHIILSGEIQQVPKSEEHVAKAALFSRHPEMPNWVDVHNWFFAKLVIKHIYLLDYFGGAKVISPEDYYAATPY